MKAAGIHEFGGLESTKQTSEQRDMSNGDQLAKLWTMVSIGVAMTAALFLPVRGMFNPTGPLRLTLSLALSMTGGGIAFADVLTEAWLGTCWRDGPARGVIVISRMFIPRRMQHA